MLKKIIVWLIIITGIAGLSMIFYSMASNPEQPSEQVKVNHIFDFLQLSWYQNGREYDKDIETLQWIKQQQLDNLSYQDTIKYTKWEKVQNLFLEKIDETLAIAQTKKKELEKPAYLTVNSTSAVSKDSSSSELVFQKLLK